MLNLSVAMSHFHFANGVMSPTNLYVQLGNIMPACYESKIIMPMKTFIASGSKEKENQNVWQNSWRVAPKDFWFSLLEKRCITKYYANQLSLNCFLPANLPLKISYQNGLTMNMRGVVRSGNSHDKKYFSYYRTGGLWIWMFNESSINNCNRFGTGL